MKRESIMLNISLFRTGVLENIPACLSCGEHIARSNASRELGSGLLTKLSMGPQLHVAFTRFVDPPRALRSLQPGPLHSDWIILLHCSEEIAKIQSDTASTYIHTAKENRSSYASPGYYALADCSSNFKCSMPHTPCVQLLFSRYFDVN